MKKINKLGVFDSGVGGLSVLKELLNLPIPEIIYVADTANLPYGEKTPEQIIGFTTHIIKYFTQQNVDAVVIACHTASAIALEHVQKLFPHLLIIGVVDSVVQDAVTTTKNFSIGVIGTPATIARGIHQEKISAIMPQAQVTLQACPKLVPLIESGLYNQDELRAVLEEYLAPLKKAACDSIIIGCTHYELILEEIRKNVGEKSALISAPKTTALQLKKFLAEPSSGTQPVVMYRVTGDVQQFKLNTKKLLGWDLDDSTLRTLRI